MSIIYIVLFFLFFIVFPFSITKLLYNFQNKCSNEKIVTLVDILSFLFFTVYGFALLYIISIAVAGMSSDSTMNYMLIVYIRNFIGFLCGLLYSFLINFRQMTKYLEKLLIEQKENLFIWIFIIGIFLVLVFVKLCHTWSL